MKRLNINNCNNIFYYFYGLSLCSVKVLKIQYIFDECSIKNAALGFQNENKNGKEKEQTSRRTGIFEWCLYIVEIPRVLIPLESFDSENKFEVL